jgi:hypothetical protein
MVDEDTSADEFVVPDGWVWRLIDVTCGNCNAVNKIHEQPPAWLETPAGVKWECNSCGAANQLGGTGVPIPLEQIAECGECRHTFDNRPGSTQVEIADDGTWTCPDCDTVNRLVGGSESASAGQTAEVSQG